MKIFTIRHKKSGLYIGDKNYKGLNLTKTGRKFNSIDALKAHLRSYTYPNGEFEVVVLDYVETDTFNLDTLEVNKNSPAYVNDMTLIEKDNKLILVNKENLRWIST